MPAQQLVLGTQLLSEHLVSLLQHWPGGRHRFPGQECGCVDGHPQLPLLQRWAPGQLLPHEPQLLLSVFRLTHRSLHQTCSPGQQSFRLFTQTVGMFGHAWRVPEQPQSRFLQISWFTHLFPQAPQFALLLTRLWQTPSQTRLGLVHLQMPSTHCSASMQGWLQVPQFALSVLRLTQD